MVLLDTPTSKIPVITRDIAANTGQLAYLLRLGRLSTEGQVSSLPTPGCDLLNSVKTPNSKHSTQASFTVVPFSTYAAPQLHAYDTILRRLRQEDGVQGQPGLPPTWGGEGVEEGKAAAAPH